MRQIWGLWSKMICYGLNITKISITAYNSLHLIRWALSSSASVCLRKMLYLSLVHSHLTYYCQLWKPHFLKDIANLERIQRRATKYIFNDYYRSTTNYKDRLITFTTHILVWSARPHAPAEMFKDPEDSINIYRYITLILYHLELVQQLAIN